MNTRAFSVLLWALLAGSGCSKKEAPDVASTFTFTLDGQSYASTATYQDVASWAGPMVVVVSGPLQLTLDGWAFAGEVRVTYEQGPAQALTPTYVQLIEATGAGNFNTRTYARNPSGAISQNGAQRWQGDFAGSDASHTIRGSFTNVKP